MSQNLNDWKKNVKLYGSIELLKDAHGRIHEQLYYKCHYCHFPNIDQIVQDLNVCSYRDRIHE